MGAWSSSTVQLFIDSLVKVGFSILIFFVFIMWGAALYNEDAENNPKAAYPILFVAVVAAIYGFWNLLILTSC